MSEYHFDQNYKGHPSNTFSFSWSLSYLVSIYLVSILYCIEHKNFYLLGCSLVYGGVQSCSFSEDNLHNISLANKYEENIKALKLFNLIGTFCFWDLKQLTCNMLRASAITQNLPVGSTTQLSISKYQMKPMPRKSLR